MALRMPDGHRAEVRTCQRCEKTFLAAAHNVAKGRGRFCSTRCCLIVARERQRELYPDGTAKRKPGALTNIQHKRNFLTRHPRIAKAYRAWYAAKRRGVVVAPDRCARCQAVGMVHGHHRDYADPFGVEWLCRPCHRVADGERRALESFERAAALRVVHGAKVVGRTA